MSISAYKAEYCEDGAVQADPSTELRAVATDIGALLATTTYGNGPWYVAAFCGVPHGFARREPMTRYYWRFTADARARGEEPAQ